MGLTRRVVPGGSTIKRLDADADLVDERNIEAGVVIDDAELARRVTRQFDHFVESGVLKKLL